VKTDVGEAEPHAGDNDPTDAIELGTVQLRAGEVRRVKVLGAIAMIEQGEVDWKVLCLCVDDPYASRINSLEDLLATFPNAITAVRDWFRVGYDLKKESDGLTQNQFAFGGKPMNREYALRLLEEAHNSWKGLTLSGQTTV
jgi:inorganic pyrophosphatase